MSNFSTKIASTASVVALVATAMSASLVSAASEFLPYAELLADNSVIGVQTNEAGYRLGDAITRGELAKITANVGGLTAVEPTGTVFGDVSAASVGDLAGYIEALAEAGIVSTANANFRPKANVTRAEAVKLLLGALGEEGSSVDAGYTDIANLGDLAMYINRANELGVIADGTYFRPNASITRGEAFKIAANAAKDVLTTPTVPPTTTTGTTTTGSTTVGALTVALDGVAAAQYVPMNASNVKVGTVKVTAGTSDVTVNSLTVNRSGLGDSVGLTIAIGQGGTVMSESRSVNTATQDAIVRLNNPTMIKAGTTVSFDVLVSVAGSANSQHQFTLKAVGTPAAVTGAPITLGLLNTTSYTVSSVTVQSVKMNGVTSGKNNQSLGTVELRAGSKDVTLGGFTLSKNAGVDMTKALTNVSVYKNSVKVGTASVTSDKIYVSGLATKVARNDVVTFELRGDVTYVGSNLAGVDDIKLQVADSMDVSGTEDLTGYAVSVSGAPTAVGPTTTIVLSSLDLIWTKNTAKSVTIAPGTSNVVLFDAKVTSSASFDVTEFKLNANGTTPATNFANTGAYNSLTLTVNGVDYDLLTTNIAAGLYTFNKTADKFRIDAGTPANVRLTANFSNTAPVGTYSYKVTITKVKNVSTSNEVTLSKDITGDNVTVSAPTITLKSATIAAPSASKIYSNATGLEIGRFALEAKAEEVTVREITLANTGLNQVNDFTKLVTGTNVKLVNVADNTEVSATVTVNAADIKFTGMSIKVPKDTTANFKVLANTQGDLVTTFPATTVVAVPGVAEVSTFTVAAGPSTVAGTIAVTVNGTTYTTPTLIIGTTAAQAALAIKTAIGATATCADAPCTSGVVTVTAATTGVQTNASVGAMGATTLTVTAATTTEGVTAVTGVTQANNLKFSVAVVSASSSSLSSIVNGPFTTTKTYSVSVIPPTVTLVKVSANKFLVKVTNADADQDITLTSISAQVRPVSVANSSYKGYACIREEGSSEKCLLAPVASKVQEVPGAGITFNTTVDAVASLPVLISKNSSITREIFVDSAFVNPSDLQAEITALNYGVSETYSVIAQ